MLQCAFPHNSFVLHLELEKNPEKGLIRKWLRSYGTYLRRIAEVSPEATGTQELDQQKTKLQEMLDSLNGKDIEGNTGACIVCITIRSFVDAV